MSYAANDNEEIHFDTLVGELRVSKNSDGSIRMNFPQYEHRSFGGGAISNDFACEFYPQLDAPEYLLKLIRVSTIFASNPVQIVVPEEIKIEALAYAVYPKALIVVVDSDITKSTERLF